MRLKRSRSALSPAVVWGMSLGLALAASLRTEAADSKEGAVTVQKTKEGLHFNLPPDWPVEKRGGVMAPIPIEEYLSRKFSAMSSQLQLLEQRLNGLDVRLRVVEEELKKQRQTTETQNPTETQRTALPQNR